ncbi:MAG TPA: SDR family oxidoreductase [Solirubrobacteraceae bacterium]|nr:SDR family oxidoreductase [Solirubrobacteraceae bacterium]
MTDLRGRVALITGGSAGIGLAIARMYALAGADVCIVARRPEPVDAVVAELVGSGRRAIGCVGSIADEAVRQTAIERCVSELGALDILVNNAASQGPIGPLVSAAWPEVSSAWTMTQDVPLLMAQLAWEARMRDHGGSIINIVSLAGIRAYSGFGAYGVAKAALIHLTRQLALELAPAVRVNAIAPGLVKTEMSARARADRDEEREASLRPMKRLGIPDDIAAAALFLVSDAASWITGQTLTVDGGTLLR